MILIILKKGVWEKKQKTPTFKKRVYMYDERIEVSFVVSCVGQYSSVLSPPCYCNAAAREGFGDNH